MCWRTPATQRELRAAIALITDYREGVAEYGIYPTPRRLPKRTPNAWDDVPKGNWHNQGWKEHRSTQYRCRFP